MLRGFGSFVIKHRFIIVDTERIIIFHLTQRLCHMFSSLSSAPLFTYFNSSKCRKERERDKNKPEKVLKKTKYSIILFHSLVDAECLNDLECLHVLCGT